MDKFLIALVLYKGVELKSTNKRGDNLFAIFHLGIVALLFVFLLSGCGYKTAPVYHAKSANVASLQSV